MSNNISRKGLAFGALVAIVTSLFAGAPAQAAEVVALDSTYGTSQVVPAGDNFTLTATIDSGSYQSLSVRVENTDAAAAVVSVDNRAATYTTIATSDARATLAPGVFTANSQTISLRATDKTVTSHFTVTVWKDWHNTGVVDGDEASASKVITFLKSGDLAATTRFVTYPTYTNDARTLKASVELTNVNTAQVRNSATFNGSVSVDFRVGTYDVRDSLTTTARATTTISGDNRFYTGDVTIVDDRNHWFAGAVYTAQAYTGTVAIGAKVSTAALTNIDPTAAGITLVNGANALTYPGVTTDSRTGDVRKNSAFQVKVTLTGDSKAAVAGQTVKFSVGGTWATSTIRVTVEGTVYSTSADLRAASFSKTADADGVALLNVSVAGSNVASATDLTFSAVVGTRSTGVLTASQTAAAATTVSATPATQAVELGKAASVSVTLKDQFGEAVTSGYEAQALYYDGPGTSASETHAPLTNGAATLAITVDGTVTGSTRYTIVAREVASNGSYGASVNARTVAIVTRAAADLVSGYIKIGGNTETLGVRTAAARVSVDAKALTGAKASAFTAVAQSISGRVVITGDRGTPYAKVTLAGTGLFFVNADGGFDAASTVATADVDGYFTVTVRSNTTGTATVKVTSGSAAAQSISWTVDAPSAQDATAVVSANDDTAVALVGKTVTVTFSARDTFGNTVTAYGSSSSTPTLTVRVSGDVTRDAYGVDANGAITVSGVAPAATGVAYFTVTLSNDARVVTKQVRVEWVKETVTVDAPEAATAGQNVDVVVTVLDPNGDPIKGYEVTATSTGVGNLTVAKATTDVNGQAYLKLFAATGELGWAYVTATSTTGSVVADVAGVQFQAAPTATDNVATLTLAVPASAQAGTVVDVVATATDADGNAVQGAVVSATSTGVGYLAVAGGTTDADGKVTLKLVVTAGENGTASVVAAAGDVTSEAASVTAGVTDANVTLAKKRVTVDWSFAANKKVVIVRDGVVIKSFTASSNAADSFSFNLKKGTHKVSVKVGGVTLDSQSYKIK